MLYFGIFPSLVRFYLNLPQFGRVTSSINHFSFQNNRISGRICPAPQSVVITVFKRIHHHRFNDSIALPLAISPMSLSNRCLDPSFELLHSLSSHDHILTKAGNPLAQISSPWCEALPNETLLVKTVLLLLLLLLCLVCLWAPVKAAIRVHEYADGRREPI